MALFDNYTPRLGVAEPPCDECRREQDDFLAAVIDTRPMRTAWEFLIDKGSYAFIIAYNAHIIYNQVRRVPYARASTSI